MNKYHAALLALLAERVRVLALMVGDNHHDTLTAMLILSDTRARMLAGPPPPRPLRYAVAVA